MGFNDFYSPDIEKDIKNKNKLLEDSYKIISNQKPKMETQNKNLSALYKRLGYSAEETPQFNQTQSKFSIQDNPTWENQRQKSLMAENEINRPKPTNNIFKKDINIQSLPKIGATENVAPTQKKSLGDNLYDFFIGGRDSNTTIGKLNKREEEKKSKVSDYISKYGYLPKNATKEEEEAYYNRFSQEYGIREKNSLDWRDSNRIISSIADAIAPGQADEMDILIRQNSQNKGSGIGNAVTNMAGNMIGMAMNPGSVVGGGKNLLNVTDDLAEGVARKVTPKIGQIGQQAVRGIVDGSVGGALDTVRGNDFDNLGSNVVGGAIGGGVLSAGGSAIGKGINKLANINNPELTVNQELLDQFSRRSMNDNNISMDINSNLPDLPNTTRRIKQSEAKDILPTIYKRIGEIENKRNNVDLEPSKVEVINNTTNDIKPTVEPNNVNKIDFNEEVGKVDYNNRDLGNLEEVSNRKINSITKDMYELQPYLQKEAEATLEELKGVVKGKRFVTENGTIGQEKSVSPTLQAMFDLIDLNSNANKKLKGRKLTEYEQIEVALNKIKDGKVDDAISKRIELILDDNLMNGSVSIEGYEIPPNADYLEVKNLYKKMSDGDFTDFEPMKSSNSEIASTVALDKVEPINPNEKLSRHSNVTALNSDNVNEVTKKILNDSEFTYESVTNAEDYSNAMNEVKGNTNTYNEWLNGKYKGSMNTAIGEALFKDFEAKGDYNSAASVMETLTKNLSKAGQEVQAAVMLNKATPEGTLAYIQRQVNKANEEILEKPKVKKKIEAETNKLKTELDKANNDAIDNIVDEITNTEKPKTTKELNKLTLEERLNKKITPHLSDGYEKSFNNEQALINTLYSIAKKTLPEKNKSIPTDPLTFVVDAINNKNKYQDVWNKAKDLLKEKYNGDEEKLQLLDDWFNQKARPIFSEMKANQSISKALKDKNIDLRQVVKGYYSGSATKDIKEYLIKEAGLTGDDANILGNYISKRIKDLTSETKTKIIDNILKDKPKAQSKTEIEKIIELSNMGVLQNENLRGLVLDKMKLPKITGDDAKQIIQLKKQQLSITDTRQKEILQGQIHKIVNSKIPASVGEQIESYRYMNMLLNPKTMIKNVGGNLINSTMRKGRDILGNQIDNVISKATGVKTVFNPNTKANLQGFIQGAKNTIEDHKLGIDTSMSARDNIKGNTFGKYQGDNHFVSAIDTALGKGEQLLHTGLQLGDRPFYDGAYNEYLTNVANKLGVDVDKVPQEYKNIAHQVALEETFQQKTKLASDINRFKNSENAVVKNIAKTVLPFSQTPSAILDTAINYTPAGLVRGAYNTGKAINNKNVLPLEELLNTQRKGASQLASGVIGTGAMGLGYLGAKNGLISGSYSDDSDVRQLQQDMGMQEYALNVGDKAHGIEFAQPSATPLMLGADLYHNKGKNMLSAAADSMLGNSYLSGLQNLFNGYSYGGWQGVGEEVVGNYVSQMSPLSSLANNINKTLDNTKRETKGENFADTQLRKSMAKYPMLSQMLPEKKGLYGDTMEWNKGLNSLERGLNNSINPSNMTSLEATPQQEIALDNYNSTGEKLGIPSRKVEFTFSGKKYVPTTEEMQKYYDILQSNTKNRKNINELDDAVKNAKTEFRKYIQSKHNFK